MRDTTLGPPLSIAIAGTRGVPPRYGGFETFAAELSTRLVRRGHHVAVYCREGFTDGESAARMWQGVERIVVPHLRGKYFETVTHTFFSAFDALSRGFDVVLLCNAANAATLPLFRTFRVPVAINVDGIERRRRKWNALGRAFYAIGESLSVLFADRIVADAEVIERYYREAWGAYPLMIPYGADFPHEGDTAILATLGILPREYLLYVSRFEPENNPLPVVEALLQTNSRYPLVMVGEGRYAPDLVRRLREHAGSRVLFPGGVYGADYRTLQRNARLYIQATEVGGTHPALIEAMGSGGYVIANDTPENREAGGAAVRYFTLAPENTLARRIEEALADPLDEQWRERARERAVRLYSWERVTDQYERLFRSLTS